MPSANEKFESLYQILKIKGLELVVDISPKEKMMILNVRTKGKKVVESEKVKRTESVNTAASRLTARMEKENLL